MIHESTTQSSQTTALSGSIKISTTNNDHNSLPCMICRKKHDGHWIQCDQCENWAHSICVNLNEKEVDMIDKYFCNDCEIQGRGRTTRKKPFNLHRYDSTIDDEKMELKTQVGTFKFLEDLKKIQFKSMTEIDIIMNGEDLKMSFLKKNGFYQPILVRKKEHLDMKLPKDFSYDMLIKALGPDHKLEVINVNHQTLETLTLADFINKFKCKDRPKTYNCISLELSQTKLSKYIQPPKIVRKMSWADKVFEEEDRPAVQKYCLLSMKDSYTDFHIDFSGTSVWYHVVEGEKRFFFIEPTEEHIDMYETWQRTDDNNEHFLPDIIGHEKCYEFTLQPGDTMFIPAGWIHAVLTPKDSVVFGGNYLQTWGSHLQIRVFEGELRCGFLDKFKFPFFKLTHWCATWFVYKFLRNLCDSGFLTKKSVTENELHRKIFKSFESFREFTLKFHEEIEEAKKRWKKTKCEDEIKEIFGGDYKDKDEFETILKTYESHNYLTSLKNMKDHYLDHIRPDSEVISDTKNEHSNTTLNNLELPQKSVNLKRKDQELDTKSCKKTKSQHSASIESELHHKDQFNKDEQDSMLDNESNKEQPSIVTQNGPIDHRAHKKDAIIKQESNQAREDLLKNRSFHNESTVKELKELCDISQIKLSPRPTKNLSPNISRTNLPFIIPIKKTCLPPDLIASNKLKSFKIPKKIRSEDSTKQLKNGNKSLPSQSNTSTAIEDDDWIDD